MLKEKLKTMSKKKIVGLVLLAIIAILLWQVSIPIVVVWIIFKKIKTREIYKWLSSFLFVLIYLLTVGFIYVDKSIDQDLAKGNYDNVTDSSSLNNINIIKKEDASKGNNIKEIDLISKIENKASQIDASSVSVFNSDNSDMASPDSEPPYNVVIMNKNHGSATDCFDAKNSLMKSMKAIYGDESLSGKVLNVKFFALPSISASLGYNEAKYVDWSKVGGDIGPSIFWKNLTKKEVQPTSYGLPSDMWGYTKNNCN